MNLKEFAGSFTLGALFAVSPVYTLIGMALGAVISVGLVYYNLITNSE